LLGKYKFIGAGRQPVFCTIQKIFGQSVKDILEKIGLTVSLKDNSEQADVLVTALGEPHKIKKR